MRQFFKDASQVAVAACEHTSRPGYADCLRAAQAVVDRRIAQREARGSTHHASAEELEKAAHALARTALTMVSLYLAEYSAGAWPPGRKHWQETSWSGREDREPILDEKGRRICV